LGCEGGGRPVGDRAVPTDDGRQAGLDQGAGERVSQSLRRGRGRRAKLLAVSRRRQSGPQTVGRRGAETGGQKQEPRRRRAQGAQQSGRVSGIGAAAPVFEQQDGAQGLPGVGLPGMMAVTGQVQHRQAPGGGEVLAQGVGLAALLHQQVEVGGAHGIEDGGLLGLVVELGGARRGGGHEGEAQPAVIQGGEWRDGSKAALGAELEQSIGGEITVVVGQQFPGCLEQGPFHRAGGAARAVDAEQQRGRGALQQPVEEALIAIDPAVEVAADGKGRGRVRALLQEGVAHGQFLEEAQRVTVERAPGADRRVVDQQAEAVVLNQDAGSHAAVPPNSEFLGLDGDCRRFPSSGGRRQQRVGGEADGGCAALIHPTKPAPL